MGKTVVLVFFIVCSACGGCVEQTVLPEPEAKDFFTKMTGISWQDDFILEGFRDKHSSFNGDGEYGLVVCVPDETLEQIQKTLPSWKGEWQSGPVDGEIGFHCAFIYNDPPSYGTSNGVSSYSGGSEEVRRILSSTDTLWSAEDRGPDSISWHNGNLIVLDLSNNRIWLSSWDF